MRINLKEFLSESGIVEPFYPGKRLVHPCKQVGPYKNHCIVLDWRDPEKLRIEVKAGISGRDLEPEKLKYYPVSFQAPTYVDVEFVNDNKKKSKKEEEEEGKSSSGSGGKKPKKIKNMDEFKSLAASAFESVMEGNIPEIGEIVEMMVLGTKIAKDAYGAVMGKLAEQIQKAKIGATELLEQAGDFVTKYTPPSFMEPKGDEKETYKYDREKNANIGYRMSL